MTTLTIKDLPLSDELDIGAMSAVRGGASFCVPGYDLSRFEFTFSTQQFINQTQDTKSQNGVGVAFSGDITSKVEPRQTATNNSNINIGSGLALP